MGTGANRVTQSVCLGGQAVHVPSYWYHADRLGEFQHFPQRIGNHITPLVCGLETKRAVREAIDNAESSIDISLWGFDPAIMMDGYYKDIEDNYTVGASMNACGADGKPRSPKLGDLLLDAHYRRKRQVRLLLWDIGSMLCDPYRILRGIDKSAINEELAATLIAQGWLPNVDPITYQPYSNYSQVQGRITGEDRSMIGWAAPNWRYRYNWWKKIYTDKPFPVVFTGSSPANLIPDLAAAIAIHTFGLTQDFDESVPFLQKVFLSGAKTHHQKIVLVDYGKPEKAVGFVMGQNFRLVDSDSHKHPADAPEMGGRYLNEDPRQDISCRVRGPVLYDINDNFETNWGRVGSPSFRKERPTAHDFTFTPTPTESPIWPAQFSVTMMGNGEVGYIQDAYEKAIACSTRYIYLENQYFRFSPVVEKMKEHAAGRFAAASHETARPLYYFLVMNMPDRYAQGATYNAVKALGHEQQMPGERTRRYRDLIAKRDKYVLTKPDPNEPELAKMNEEIDAIEASYPGGSVPSPVFCGRGPDEVENPEDSFTVTNTSGLKGHLATMMVCKPGRMWGYNYKYVNIHSKMGIFDDTFAIIGSANLNKRSMAGDAEAVIGTTQLGLASGLRCRLFTGLLGTPEYNDQPVDILYNYWDTALKENWKNQYHSKPLVGTVNFLYDDTAISLPDAD